MFILFSLCFYFVLFLLCTLFADIWCEMERILPKSSRNVVENMYLAGKRNRNKKKANEALTNKQKGALHTFLKRSKPESVNMATFRETAGIYSVKNAETAVVNVVREEDNDITLTADQYVVMGNEQNVVDPLRNLVDPPM